MAFAYYKTQESRLEMFYQFLGILIICKCYINSIVPRCGASGFLSLTALVHPESVAASAMCAVAKLWNPNAPR